jgi:hypothetical protein
MNAEKLLDEIYEACPEVNPRGVTFSLNRALAEIDKTMSNIKNTSISSSAEIVDSLLDIRAQVSIALSTTVILETGE